MDTAAPVLSPKDCYPANGATVKDLVSMKIGLSSPSPMSAARPGRT
jgi:hypothetical protein